MTVRIPVGSKIVTARTLHHSVKRDSMLSIGIEVFFQEDTPNGEDCSGCAKEILTTRWVLMMQVGDPLSFAPTAMHIVYCTECKEEYEGTKQGQNE
jgi:hypothetical protein